MRVEFREQPSTSLILWRGRQWLVTSDGIETVNTCPRLLIRKKQFSEQSDRKIGARAVEHICPTPFDADDFAEAWYEALKIHVSH